MRLADFILANVEPILVEWEAFARSIWPGQASVQADEVRDDAEALLHETVRDMQSQQSEGERADKSRGGKPAENGDRLEHASSSHAMGRVTSGFDLWGVVAEY